jgi:RNA polymerase sigma-70 factor, ECF subfamily
VADNHPVDDGKGPASTAQAARQAVDAVYRSESRRVLATLIRLLGDFDLAEEALAEAFAAAVQQWPRDGVPANPRAWLVSAGRFKAIDGLRRRARFDASVQKLAQELQLQEGQEASAVWTGDGAAGAGSDGQGVEDDRLRLVFTCCHPALQPDAQVALTLREVCGLTTEEIAHAFLTTAPTLAQRIVRAKARIRDAHIPYEIPGREDLPDRLDTVLRVIYLVFNEGYSASYGASLTRQALSEEAIRLGRLILELLPEPEVMGLLALMILHESRRAARATPQGEIILLADQDRSLWNLQMIEEGITLVNRALASRRIGPYTLQAAIAAVHARAADAAQTDWNQIVGLYDVLARADPSPVVNLNRAVAVAMRDGPEAGLELVEGILARGELADYQFAHAVRADFCRRLGRTEEARASYKRALSLSQQEPEKRFLRRRLEELEAGRQPR